MAVTIEQIAERAGVSSSTVARVLRGDVKGAQQRSARNAAEILRISEELGYRPNWRARALSRGKTHTIGMLYDDANWIFEEPMSNTATAFTASLQKLNYDLRLIPVGESSDWKELVYGSAVDGIAFLSHIPEAACDLAREGRLPTVLLNDKFEQVPHATPDDTSGGYLATRHLTGLGHKQIAFYISETIRPHYSIAERLEGYRRAMLEAGLENEQAVWDFDIQEATTHLLSNNRPTAIVCYCQIEALQIANVAWSNGLSIPADISLVAFNDISITQWLTPPLTVIGYDTQEIGRVGAEMLIAQITEEDPSQIESVNFSEKLVIRGTTAAPRGKG